MTASNRSVLSRHLILSLYVPALVLSLGQGIILPALPVYAKSFGVGFGEAALLFVFYQAGDLAATFPTGFLLDKFGRRPVLLAAPILSAGATLMMVFAGSFPELLLYRFIAGAAQEFWHQARLAVIADSAHASARGRQVAWMVGIQRAGTMFGPAFGGLLAVAIDVRAPFVAYAVLLLAILPCFLMVKESAPVKAAAPATSDTASDGSSTPAAAEPSLLRYLLTLQILTFFAIQIFSTMCRAAQDGTFNLYAVYSYGVGPDTLGWVSAMAGVAALPIPFATGYLMDRWGRRKVIMPAFTLLAFALAFVAGTAFGQLEFAWYVAGYILTQMSQSTTNGTMQVLGADMAPPGSRGRFFGVWRFVSQIGGMAAPWLFAVVAESVNYGSAFLMLAGFSASTAALTLWVLKETGGRDKLAANAAAAQAQTAG